MDRPWGEGVWKWMSFTSLLGGEVGRYMSEYGEDNSPLKGGKRGTFSD